MSKSTLHFMDTLKSIESLSFTSSHFFIRQWISNNNPTLTITSNPILITISNPILSLMHTWKTRISVQIHLNSKAKCNLSGLCNSQLVLSTPTRIPLFRLILVKLIIHIHKNLRQCYSLKRRCRSLIKEPTLLFLSNPSNILTRHLFNRNNMLFAMFIHNQSYHATRQRHLPHMTQTHLWERAIPLLRILQPLAPTQSLLIETIITCNWLALYNRVPALRRTFTICHRSLVFLQFSKWKGIKSRLQQPKLPVLTDVAMTPTFTVPFLDVVAHSQDDSISKVNMSTWIWRLFSELWLGHLRSHTSERPFACEWPGCDKAFARQHDCKRHYQLHSTKAGTYLCQGCGKSFSRTDALNRHREFMNSLWDKAYHWNMISSFWRRLWM